METVVLTVEKRADTGKKASKKLRNAGKMPCIMYGGNSSEKLTVDSAKLKKTLSGKNETRVILELDIDGKKHNTVLRELQYHPITDKLIHADLMEIDIKKPITLKLPVRLEGEPVGVKLKGGELRLQHPKLTVTCLPTVMPSEIILDVSELDLDESIHVKDVPIGEGISLDDPPDTSVASVTMPKAIEEEKAETPEGEEEAKPEGEGEGETAPAKETDDDAKKEKGEKK